MKSIAKKILAVSNEIGVITKGGTNQHFNFKFQQWDDVVPAVRAACVKHGLAIVPSCELLDRTGDRVTVKLDIKLMDADSGETLDTSWVGEALDKQDKGVQKAITSGTKYLLLKLFLVPTYGEDPDAAGPVAVPVREAKATTKLDEAKRALMEATGLEKLKEYWAPYAPYLSLVEAADQVKAAGATGVEEVTQILTAMMAGKDGAK